MVLLWGVFPLWIWYTFFGPGYLAEFRAVRAELEALPGVEIVCAGGTSDTVFECIWAKLEVKGKGQVGFAGLTVDSFDSGGAFDLVFIGGYGVSIIRRKYLFTSGEDIGGFIEPEAIDRIVGLGPYCISDPLAQLFPFPLENLQDVIEHYDDICELLENWPTQPSYAHLQGESGIDYYYSLINSTLDDDFVYPWAWECD